MTLWSKVRRSYAIDLFVNSKNLPVPIFQTLTNEEINESTSGFSTEKGTDDDHFAFSQNLQKQILFHQDVFNNLVLDLNIPKVSAELLASRLCERILLSADTKIFFYRGRETCFLEYFCLENGFVFCFNVQGLFNMWGCVLKMSEGCLLIAPKLV